MLKKMFEKWRKEVDEQEWQKILSLARTTENASQTDRDGEQVNEVGLVQSPDNAETVEKRD